MQASIKPNTSGPPNPPVMSTHDPEIAVETSGNQIEITAEGHASAHLAAAVFDAVRKWVGPSNRTRVIIETDESATPDETERKASNEAGGPERETGGSKGAGPEADGPTGMDALLTEEAEPEAVAPEEAVEAPETDGGESHGDLPDIRPETAYFEVLETVSENPDSTAQEIGDMIEKATQGTVSSYLHVGKRNDLFSHERPDKGEPGTYKITERGKRVLQKASIEA